jgi:RNA polymerase sigma-70 factor (ECF subfamily)
MTVLTDQLGGSALSEASSFPVFYAEALPVVYSYFFHRVGGNASIAEELTQVTFVAAVREIRRRSSVAKPIPWVMGIARHKLLDHYRRQARDERRVASGDEALAAADLAMPAEGADVRERALAALAALPASQRAVLVLRYLDGLSVPEVARSVGRSLHATESLLARGRQAFKRAYAEATDV